MKTSLPSIFTSEKLGTIGFLLETVELLEPLEFLEDGDVIQVYSYKDYSDLAFQNAIFATKDYQTPNIRAYDLFKVTSVSTPTLEYLGNLAQPAIEPYYTIPGIPSKSQEFVASKKGKIITLEDGLAFTEDLVGNYFNWGYLADSYEFNGHRDYITGFTDANNITVQESGGVTEETLYYNNFLQGPIYASYYHQQLEKVVIQAGDRLYESTAPINGWREIPGIHDSKDTSSGVIDERPQEAEGLFHEVQGDLILSNNNGHYRVIFSAEGAYYFKINEQKPETRPVSKPVKVWGFADSEHDKSIEIVGFPGYNAENEDRGGGKYYINGVIL